MVLLAPNTSVPSHCHPPPRVTRLQLLPVTSLEMLGLVPLLHHIVYWQLVYLLGNVYLYPLLISENRKHLLPHSLCVSGM
jgi:hypothetical protein